jgi:hypothetical protein
VADSSELVSIRTAEADITYRVDEVNTLVLPAVCLLSACCLAAV